MSTLTDPEVAACPAAARQVLVDYIAGKVSAEIALMHLLLATGGLAPLQSCLQTLRATGREPLLRLAQLASEHPEGLAKAAGLVEAGLTGASGADMLSATREQYDRAVAVAPEAAVALYSLGDPAILDRATSELVALLDDWGLLGTDRVALDIGCGIGRIERALAARLRHITGIDLSPAMIAEAKRRSIALANIDFLVCNGRELPQFSAAAFDLVVAIDSFPCVVAVSPEIARRYIGDAARLLRPDGTLAIFNYSYRGNPAADRAEITACAKAAGLRVLRNGTRDLALWDGTSFVLSAPPHRE
jgi:SAM-dependent methyltransferase